MNTISWHRCQKSQFCSPLVPGGLTEVRGTKKVILAWTSSPAGFTVWLHKHLCQHKAGRVSKGWNKWSGWGRMRMFLLLTSQDWIVYETVVEVPHWYPNREMGPAVPNHLSAGPDSLIPQTRCHFPVTLLLKTRIFFCHFRMFPALWLKKTVCWNRTVLVSKCNTNTGKSLNFRA